MNRFRPVVLPLALATACCALAACNASNNPVMGHVQAEMNGHTVMVLDCYTFLFPSVESVGDAKRFAPCKGVVVQVKGQSLYVNGQGYGDLAPGDHVEIRKGKVRIIPSD